LSTFKLAPGLRIELVAAEPMVVGPVAVAFDEAHRLFVVENRGYPDPMNGQAAPAIGRIARLEDRDGDGRFETRTEFATGLTYPNGILPWRGGVFVTCAPDILYLKDNDGDGVADERRVVLTGFSTTRTAQIRVSHPTLGLDGKVYVTSGLNGGKVTSPLHPERPPVVFTVADGRFDPVTFEFESLGGRAQFGQSFDAYGRRFICSNRHPVMQVVLDPAQLRRNPDLAFADTVQNVSKVEAEAVVWPISRVSVTADFIPSLMSKPHSGTFTAASGVWVYSGTALGPDYVGSVFICESAQNLVQRQVLRSEGVSFRAEPAVRGSEFLSSTDPWFRPVSLAQGPDGALYVVDMCRREIDHPAYVPEESRGKLDFVSGNDRGRIYRVRREGQIGRVTQAVVTTASLIRELDSPDGWWRERAQRLLVERAEPGSAGAIERVATHGRLPEGRARALWTMAGLGQLNSAVLRTAARDAVAGVREQAVVLAGGRLAAQPELAEVVLAAGEDADVRVRFCAALAMGSWKDGRAAGALAALAARDGEDRWLRAAVLSGVGGRLEAFRGALAERQNVASPAALGPVMEDLGRLLGSSATMAACGEFLGQALWAEAGTSWRVSAVLGLAEGMRTRAEFKSRPPGAVLAAVAAANGGPGAAALGRFFAQAVTAAADSAGALAARSAAIAVLGYTEFERGLAGLGPLLDARQAPELQLQVVRAFERAGEARGAELLVQPQFWSRYTPQIREAVIAALVAKPAMAKVLFAAIRRGEIRAAEISSVRRTQLLKHTNAELSAAAKELFQSLEGGDRMAVYRTYRELLGRPAAATQGAPLFERACSACHTLRGAGGKVGPDLTGVRNQPAEALLLHILVPNYEVAPAYQAVAVTMQDGRALSGWIAAETDNSVTLRTAAGTEENVLRRDIASIASGGVSLMPDGLEQTMTKEELMSLIAYLKADAVTVP
jgi:putative membrane-bound dehydrogenase-like protein